MNLKGVNLDESGAILSLHENRSARLVIIEICELESIRFDHKYAIAKSIKCEVNLDSSTRSIEAMLPELFIRVNRGAIISIAMIESLKNHVSLSGWPMTTVMMKSGDHFEVSRRERRKVLMAFNAFKGLQK